MKKNMKLKWRKIDHQGEYVNKRQNIEARYNFAVELLEVLASRKTIINFDESIIGGICIKSFTWEKRGSIPGIVIKRATAGISLLLAISSDGLRYFQFMKGINNQDSVQLFFIDLAGYRQCKT